jgi:capsular exopolysaccharide synthesis family protein
MVFNHIVAALKLRRKVFLITLGSLLAVLVLFVITTPKRYTSEASIIVGMGRQPNTGDAPTNLPILNALMIVSGIQSGETYSELMTQSPVARDVITRLGLNATPNELLSAVKAEPVNNTSIIRLTATWATPDRSAEIANGFADAFIDRERDLVAGQATAAIGFLSQEMPAAAKRQHTAEAALTAFERQHQMADESTQTSATVTALTSLDVKAAQLKLDERQASAQLKSDAQQLAATGATAAGSESTAPNPVAENLKTQLAQVETQLGEARRTYTERHPTVVALEQQESELRREIAREPGTIVSASSTMVNPVYQQLSQQAANYRTEIAADQAGLSELAAQRKTLLTQMRALPDETVQFSALQRNAKEAEAVYSALQQRMNDAMIAKSTAISDVTITQRATPADAIARPSRMLMLALGFLLSLVLAAAVVAVLELLDRRQAGELAIRADFGPNVLGAIPDLSIGEGNEALPSLRAMTLESMLQIVRLLRYSNRKPIRSLAFTSPRPGDGKSTVAVNIAHTLAELDAPVLLVDGDLRRPSLHRLLKVNNELGLADVLKGDAGLEESIRKTGIPGLDVLTSGLPVNNPVQLLHTPALQQVLIDAEILGYQTVIVDLPAALPVVDATVIAEKVDGTVLVVSTDKADGDVVRETLTMLERSGVNNVLGIIVNRVRRDTTSDGADYYLRTTGSPLALP